MSIDTLFNSFEAIAEAPGCIASLRSLILKLAVHGELTSSADLVEDKNKRFIKLGSVMTLEYGKPLDRSLRTTTGKIPVYGANGIKATTDRPLVNGRGIVVGRKGSAGEVNITEGSFWPLDVTFFAKFEKDVFDIQYLYYLLKSLDLPKMAKGIKPGINRNDVDKIEVLSVGMDEQKRIVSKVDELMSLCDQLEQLQRNRDNLRVATRKSVIDAISTATTSDELEKAWNRIKNSWEVIADSNESVESLRLMIFGLAARGQLTVRSRHSTGSSKRKLDVLFPEDWVLRNIGEIGTVRGGKRLPKGNNWSNERNSHPYIRSTDIKNRKISEKNLVYVPDRLWSKISRYTVSANDLLITIAGTIGSVAVVPDSLEGANLTENAAKISLSSDIDPRFVMIALSSPEKLATIANLSRSTAQPKLALSRIETITIAVPSFSEQKSIVEKVDELMEICDHLDHELKVRSEVVEKLAHSVVIFS